MMIAVLVTALRLWSTTIGGPSATGTAKASGLVPNSRAVAPGGATEAGALLATRPISPRAASGVTWWASARQLVERLTLAAATPRRFAVPASSGRAASIAGWAKPWPASTVIAAPATASFGSARPSTLPTFSCPAKIGR